MSDTKTKKKYITNFGKFQNNIGRISILKNSSKALSNKIYYSSQINLINCEQISSLLIY